MEQDAEPSLADLWQEVKPVLSSVPFLVGVAILVGSVAVGYVWDAPGVALLGFVGYLVAGLLAPPRPWATGLLLGLVHAAAALAAGVAMRLLAEPSYDPWARMGAGLLLGALFLLFVVGIPVGVVVTGFIGDLVGRRVR